MTLATAILSNYYISIMICIFSCALFSDPYIGAEGRKNRGMCTGLHGIPLLAGGTGAVFADPGSDYFRGEWLAGDFFSSAVEWYFNLIAELGRQCVFCRNVYRT